MTKFHSNIFYSLWFRYAKDVKESAARSLQESISANNKTDEMINKIRLELGAKAKELQSFSAEELGAIPWKLGESQRILQKVEKQAGKAG